MNHYRAHDCESYDGECGSWGWHDPAPVRQDHVVDAPLAPWERSLLGLDDKGMTLFATVADGQAYTFYNVSVDSARMERDGLVFEANDNGGADVSIFTVPNVVFWRTTAV